MVILGYSGNSVQLVCLQTGKVCLKIHDLCRLLPSSLKRLTFDFTGRTIKGILPHEYIAREGFQCLYRSTKYHSIPLADYGGDAGEAHKKYQCFTHHIEDDKNRATHAAVPLLQEFLQVA